MILWESYMFIAETTNPTMKTCNKCKILKELSEFNKDKSRKNGYSYTCSKCIGENSKKHYASNKENILKEQKGKYNEYFKNRYKNKSNEQKEEFKDYLKKYQSTEEYKIKRRKYKKEIYYKIPKNKILNHLRKRIRDYIKGETNKIKYNEILGCSSEEYKLYLEQQFKLEMTWDNYGKVWEIDHIIPLNTFDTNNWIELKKAFHFTNTQPLFITTRIAKSLGYINEIGNRNKSKFGELQEIN